jgi:polar amino acid transport system ATP-binding protein
MTHTSTAVAAPAVELRDIHKSYDGLHVLKGCSLTVQSGQVAAIIGPSGGGKSTLLRCTNLLEIPDSGMVLRNGVPFGVWSDSDGKRHSTPRRELMHGRGKMPMVFQHFDLFLHLTALNNVVLGQRVVLGRSKAEAERIAKETLDRVGLSAKLRSYPSTLSGGQQQRVGIARALAMNPDVLLLDEPTSSLDPEMMGEVVSIIQELARDGLTMLIATHEMGLARQIASRVYFVEAGLIADEGSPQEIFDNPQKERTRDFLRAVVR